MEPDSAEEIKAQRIRFLINTLVAVGIVGGTFIIFALTWAYGYNPPKSHLTILYTNDFHGQLYPYVPLCCCFLLLFVYFCQKNESLAFFFPPR